MLPPELVRSVLESAPDAMIIIDASGVILFANRQVSALFGYDTDEVVNRPVEMLLPERFRHRHVSHRKGFTGSVRFRPMGAGLELFARRRDGTEFPVEISLSPVGESHDPMVAAAIRDVTDRARVERELRDANAAAARANLSKSRFLATASHDLRQPLQTISLLNGMLRRAVTEGEAVAALQQQEQALNAMSTLLNALLDISKLESGSVRPEVCDFGITRLFEEMHTEFSGLAMAKGLELVITPTPLHVRSDPTLVSQALKNLLDNAIKYTTTGQIRLCATQEGETVRIDVKDSGRGIAPEHLPYIFDEFYQIGVAANTSRDGYGLGLSIVQSVARLLQLRVDVHSHPGTGSDFSLSMPAGRSTHEHASEGNTRPTAAPRAGAARHILIVEDDPGVRNATRLFLKGESYRVAVAACYAEAVEQMHRNPDLELVISDLHLDGGRTGAEVIAAARARFGPGLRALLLTGDTTSDIAQLQQDTHLRISSKPISADDLLRVIQELMQP